MTPLRLFVSSPSDVRPERVRVDVVAERLNGELAGLAQIEVVRWETGFYTADRSFQEAIDAAVDNMRSTDMVVCILWKRVGSELNPTIWRRPDGSSYESGTVLEFETALEIGRQQKGLPDTYLFRKRAPIAYASESFEAERLQHQLLETVWRRWTATAAGHNVAGYQEFNDADDFEVQLELCLRQWLERKGIILKAVWDRALEGSPFRGLAAFEAAHAPIFFGREAAIGRVIAKLRQAEDAGSPFLVVVGASGSGKSSLLRAGLVPRITRPGTIPGIDLWRPALVVPAGDPLSALAEALFGESALGAELAAGDFRTPQALARCLAAGSELALPPLRAALERAARRRAETLRYEAPRPARLLIALDQVERLFVEADPGRADGFAEILHALVAEKLASVIVALRSDAYARFQLVPGFVALLEAGGAAYDLLPPGTQALDDIVTLPVAACEPPLAFESDGAGVSLAERLVADTRGGDALPLLQLTLQRLFEAEAARGDGILRFADYPGIDEAVARTAEEAVATLDEAAASELPALLTALVGDVGHDASGLLPVIVPLDRALFARGLATRTALIDAFIEARLLTAEAAAGGDRVRPTHDALLRTWPAAVRIIGEHAALIHVRHTLEPMAADWERADPAARAGYLVNSAALLAGAEGLSARFGADLPATMQDFIAASLRADAARRNAERRRQRRILAATFGGLVVALVLAGLAGWQWRTADAERARAQRSLALATETANGLIVDLAQKFRNLGLPASMAENVLDFARKLQDQLAAGGETSPALRRSQALARGVTAQTLLRLGDTKGALADAQRARDIFQALAASAPGSTDYLRELVVSDLNIGDVLKTQGRLDAALASYRGGLARANTLVLEDSGNADWQRLVAIGDQRIGEVLMAQNRLDPALAAYNDSLAIAKALAQKDPGNTRWKGDLAYGDDKIGDVLAAQGQREGALASYRDGLAIRQALALATPGDTEWKGDLAYSDDKIGDVLRAEGQLDAALATYRSGLAIRQALALEDPGNTEWRSDLAVSDEEVGDALTAQGKFDAALAAYHDGLAIIKALALKDPGNVVWQSGLAIGDNGIGAVLTAQGQLDAALAAYRDGLAIGTALALKDAGNAEWQRELFLSYKGIGLIASRQNDLAGALAGFERAATIALHLKAIVPAAATSTSDLAWAQDELAETRRKIAQAPAVKP